MKWFLLLTMVLTSAGCATTATNVGAAAGPQSHGWPAANAPAETTTVPADGGPDSPGVVVTATSPTNVQFSPDARDAVIPLTPVPRQLTHSRRRAAVHQGMWIGAGIGILAGLAMGQERDQDTRAHPEMDCDTFDCGVAALFGGVAFGAIGLGLGAAAGAIVGRIGNP